MKIKICSKCKIKKSIKDFFKDNHKKSGHLSACKKCSYIITKKYSQSLKGKQALKRYYHSAKGIYNQLKTIAKHKKIIFKLNKNRFIEWYNQQTKKCVYCKRLEYLIIKDYNGRHRRCSIDRKDNNQGYTLNNIILACHKCNTIKNDIFTFDEMIKIGKILKKKYKTV